MTKKINITTIWWWSWTFNVIYWLKKVFSKEERNISAVVTMTDSGWTTWEIRDKYWVLPSGDIRRAVCALSSNTWMVRRLFEYKFEWETWVIWWNKIWNILLTALDHITWSFEAWLEEACHMFDVEWKILPVTLDDVHLGVIFEDGTKIIWEKYIDVSETNNFERTHNLDQNVLEAFLVWWDWCLNPKAKESILNSDSVVYQFP